MLSGACRIRTVTVDVCRDALLRETLAANALRRADRYAPEAILPRLEGAYERVVSERTMRRNP